ncbi:SLAIN motif-containing protein-like isoform X1 [Callorhinchus milii]|uniref:SLAIN motif-containing protein-like isoform X1 n=1 Tax=Callorhinchus milii TaxID=7868 RepID=UPI001C3FD397|nr:SLAIN motif-containing protein-like isoform X1 [Callorhinchus milii]
MVGPNAAEPEPRAGAVGEAATAAGPSPGPPDLTGLPDADMEVKKLQDLVKKLEMQNEQLRSRSGRGPGGSEHGSSGGGGGNNDYSTQAECVGKAPSLSPGDPILCEYETLLSTWEAQVLAGGPAGAADLLFGCSLLEGELLSVTAALEEDVLDLECGTVEEDTWLYVSPKKTVTADQKAQNPLKWCRQVLDHPSPETEAACRSLLCRLDQANRWRSLYCTPFSTACAYSCNTDVTSCSNVLSSSGFLKTSTKPVLTPGYPSMHSALSSQSSIDSELSTSDDSISMGYKLQDLTDVQIMARLQEESLRQDYASSSASASRRSSSASLNSLRRGTYSDQEFDTYSLDDEDEYDHAFAQRSMHRYSPSPRSSPRSQSPVRGGAATSGRARPTRRGLQGRVSELMNYTKNQEDIRRSMPNLAKSGIRSIDSGRNSRSFESNLQMPSSRFSCFPQSPAGPSTGKLRYSTGSSNQSPLSTRQPVKAVGNSSSPLMTRHPVKAAGYPGSVSAVRRIQSPSSSSSASHSAIASSVRSSSSGFGARNTPAKSRVSGTSSASVPKSKLVPPVRRSLQPPKTHGSVAEDKWKEGCY